MENKKMRILKIPYFILFLLCSCLTVYAQDKVIVNGIIVDETGEPVIGVSVILREDRKIGTVTDMDGNFSLTVPNIKGTLIISYIGMKPLEIKIDGRRTSPLRIVLEENTGQLDEVIIVGYGQQRKASVVGAITQTSGKVLERTGGVSDIGSALTGNLPGVTTTASTGMPGEEDPQIVIRGVSSWNSSSPLVLVDGIERPMSSVDIHSVESISVLKDASATAVYGVKGANGVILITTKRGAEGKPIITGGASVAVKVPSKLPGKLDSYDALMLRNRVIESELGLSPDSWYSMTPQSIINKYRYPANLEESERYPNVDWSDWMFKDYAVSENVNVNISGGTKFVKYFAAVDYQHEGDLFKSYDNGRGYRTTYGYDRINMRSNLDFQLTNTTTLKANIAGSSGVKQGPRTDYEFYMWGSAYSTPPNSFLPRYSDGTWGYDPDGNASNSVATMALSGTNTRTTTRLTTDFTLEQDLKFLLKGLKVKGLISWDNTFLEEKRGIDNGFNDSQYKYIDPNTGQVTYKNSYDGSMFDFREIIGWLPSGGEVNNNETQRNLYYQGQINYNNTFGKHTVGGMGIFSRQETAKGSEVPHYREDWAFRATYDYAGRYFFEYNGAYNGSEKFSPKNRFAFFNSGAIGWMISEERFMKPLKFIDMLKLRASYGEIGDDNVSTRWLYMTQWEYGGDPSGIMTGLYNSNSPYTWYRESTVGNEDIHWETVRKFNFGIDYSVVNGLFSGSLEFFRDKRNDILISGSDRSTPSYFGGTTKAPYANLGRVRTTGYELELRFNKILNNDIRLWANLNMTHSKDVILERDDPALLPEYQKKAGKAIGQTYSYVDAGYYNTIDELYGSTEFSTNNNQKLPGGYNILDYNGDGVIDTYDNIPYGYSSNPQNTYSASFGVDWKGWNFFMQFYGVNNVTRQVVFTTFSKQQLIAYDEGSYWSSDNTNADVPLPRWGSTTSEYYTGTRYFYDGSYIRLKNIELGYTFRNNWVKKIGLADLKFYINGNNLWLWTRMPDDRESNFAGTGWASQGAYPTVKRINLGIKFTL